FLGKTRLHVQSPSRWGLDSKSPCYSKPGGRRCHPINNVHQGIVVPILQPKNVCHGLVHGGIQREQLCFGEAATGGVLQIVLLLVLIEPPSDIELSGRHSLLSL